MLEETPKQTPKSAIVRDVITYEENATIGRGSYNWSRAEVHHLTGECGHIRVYRGCSPPKKFFICKACKQGKPKVEITGPIGVIDRREREVRDPLAKAFINNVLKGGSR